MISSEILRHIRWLALVVFVGAFVVLIALRYANRTDEDAFRSRRTMKHRARKRKPSQSKVRASETRKHKGVEDVPLVAMNTAEDDISVHEHEDDSEDDLDLMRSSSLSVVASDALFADEEAPAPVAACSTPMQNRADSAADAKKADNIVDVTSAAVALQQATASSGASPSTSTPLSWQVIEAIQAELLADDLPIQDQMLWWNEADVRIFFESGGKREPK